MRMVTAAFRENMNLDGHELVKVFLFIVKGIAAMAFLFVLGYLAAGGPVTWTVTLLLVLAAIIDLVPELATLRIRASLPPLARRLEDLQLVLTAGAYVLLIAVLTGTAGDPFVAYAAFATLWLAAFFIQESVLFLATGE